MNICIRRLCVLIYALAAPQMSCALAEEAHDRGAQTVLHEVDQLKLEDRWEKIAEHYSPDAEVTILLSPDLGGAVRLLDRESLVDAGKQGSEAVVRAEPVIESEEFVNEETSGCVAVVRRIREAAALTGGRSSVLLGLQATRLCFRNDRWVIVDEKYFIQPGDPRAE